MSVSNPSKIKVLIADDQKLVRMSLRVTLEQAADEMTVVGEATTGQEAVAMAQELSPDVVLMDIGMPIMDGITATQKIFEANPEAKVVMITTHETEADIMDAFRSGATSYCLKETAPDYLLEIVKSTAGGASWIDPKIARIVISSSLSPALPARATQDPVSTDPSTTPPSTATVSGFAPGQQEPDVLVPLTEREVDVLRLIASGRNNTEIADELCLSMNTVKSHIKNIFQKLDVKDRTAAALKALRERLV